MNNGQVELDGVIIPYYEEGSEKWYPIRYITEKFLLKGASNLQSKDKYKDYIKIQVIDYTFKGTSPQETNCMNKYGWIKYLSECKLNKNKDDNKLTRHNLFCDYIGCDNKYEIIDKVEYDDYMKYCIEEYISEHPNCKINKCTNCNRELSLHKNFFPHDARTNSGYLNICKICNTPNNLNYFCNDNQAREIYNKFGNEGYVLYTDDIMDFYIKYIHNQNEFKLKFKRTEQTKQFIIDIVSYYYKNGLFDIENLNRDYIYDNIKVYVKKAYLNCNKLYEICTDNDCKLRPYKYKKYSLGSVDFETGKEIIHRYIKDNNIVIKDIFAYNYSKLLHDCRLTQFQNNILDFVVKYYNYEYAGYKFKISSINYYKDKNNRIFDMKWLIEKELKIEIPKIPLYVTLYLLNREYVCLYYLINKKKYYDNLFEWINECYPNTFNINDFVINHYRDTFDSLEESQVNEQLKTKLTNIIYNQRNTERTINIQGMLPDWVSITEKGCLLIEFFGMYNPKSTSIRHIYYINKMQEKIEKYKELEKVGYNILFIYPDDIKHNFEGLHKKLNSIIA